MRENSDTKSVCGTHTIILEEANKPKAALTFQTVTKALSYSRFPTLWKLRQRITQFE